MRKPAKWWSVWSRADRPTRDLYFESIVPDHSSPNFAFLAEHDDVLLKQAKLAERYEFEDSETAIVKIRQLAGRSTDEKPRTKETT